MILIKSMKIEKIFESINISISYASKSAKDKVAKLGGSINLTIKEKAK